MRWIMFGRFNVLPDVWVWPDYGCLLALGVCHVYGYARKTNCAGFTEVA